MRVMRYENGNGTLDNTTVVDPDFRTLHLHSGYTPDGQDHVPVKILEYRWFEHPVTDEKQIAEVIDELKRQYAESCVIRVGSTMGMVIIYQTLVEESQGGVVNIRRTPKYKHYIRIVAEVDPLPQYITQWAIEREGSVAKCNKFIEQEVPVDAESSGS